ncbi:hypothetical protein [Dysgonomonas massiliensis]|uniref:hypothetical protein n=1 Tax=Dysgonomonas massiliensis TaxID=2040292 RepID=UPI000C76D354|nr:hypothetical protein [Dysgonomonas massiliensis]
MIERERKLLAEFELRMKQLMYLCDTLKTENQTLRNQLANKDAEISNLQDEIAQLKYKYDNLKFARALTSGNNEEAQESKKRLSKLVRDVEKCIALLKG